MGLSLAALIAARDLLDAAECEAIGGDRWIVISIGQARRLRAKGFETRIKHGRRCRSRWQANKFALQFRAPFPVETMTSV